MSDQIYQKNFRPISFSPGCLPYKTAICRCSIAGGHKTMGVQLQQLEDSHPYNRRSQQDQLMTNNTADLVKTVSQKRQAEASQLQHANFITGRRRSPRSDKSGFYTMQLIFTKQFVACTLALILGPEI